VSDHTTQHNERGYSFGEFLLLPSRQLLLLRGRQIRLGGRAFALLQYLIERPGEIVSRAELTTAVWPDRVVDDSNLKVTMSVLRRVMGEVREYPRYIATIPGRGYRFVARVDRTISDGMPVLVEDRNTVSYWALPATSELIGREQDLDIIMASLRIGRQLTVLGPGGVGKTAAACAVAKEIGTLCPDGVCFVDLATTSDPMAVAAVAVEAFNLRCSAGEEYAAIRDHLSSRRMLVLLDNCEHVRAAATLLAEQVLAAGGSSRLLATSREPLGTSDEQCYWLQPLAVPDHDDDITLANALKFPAIDLFMRCALQWTDYRFVESDSASVVRICRMFDGLPLALELAAANIDPDGPPALLASLATHPVFRNRFKGVTTSRQETLDATIDWSVALLSPTERTIFCILSVFSEWFDDEDALDVAAGQGLTPTDILLGTISLVAKSLLMVGNDETGLRYRFLDSTRRLAAARLRELPIGGAVHRRHAQRISRLLEKFETDWSGRDKHEWMSRYRHRLPDLRAALDWSLGMGREPKLGIQLTTSAIPLWFEMSRKSEAQARVETALDRARDIRCDPLTKTKLASARAWSMFYTRKLLPKMEDAWHAAIGQAKQSGHVEYELRAILGFSFYLIQTGRIMEAIEHLSVFVEIASTARHIDLMPEGERALAWARTHFGHIGDSRAVLNRLAATYDRPEGRSRMVGLQVDRYIGIRCYLPFAAWLEGDTDHAVAVARDAVSIAESRNHDVSLQNALGLAALPIALLDGDDDAVGYYAERLGAALRRASIPLWLPTYSFYTALLEDRRSRGAGLSGMRDAIDAMQRSRFTLRLGLYYGVLAQGLVGNGRFDQATEAIEAGLRTSNQQHERWCVPELKRIKASILLLMDRDRDAEVLLTSALQDARAIGARPFEKRIANTLARIEKKDQDYGPPARI
jgi:predicted ATPase/DNA-binding winged helix-turn-helix (wHTH) protein